MLLAGRAIALAAVVMLATAGLASAEVAVTDRHLDDATPTYDLRLAYPQLGLPSADAEISQWVQSLADDFKHTAAERTPAEPPYSAQLGFTVERNDDQMLVIAFVYSIFAGGAHPNTETTTFNYLLPDGLRVFVPDLLGEDGVQRVSDLAIADLTSRLLGPDVRSDASWISTGAGPYAENFESFELLNDQLVLEFDPYAVAPYAAGPQTVRIPLEALQDVIRPDPRTPLPSFDCGVAATPVELAICSDATLAQLDRRTAEAFAMRLRLEAASSAPPKVQAEQIAWLASRDAACASAQGEALVACLKPVYAARLKSLRTFAAESQRDARVAGLVW